MTCTTTSFVEGAQSQLSLLGNIDINKHSLAELGHLGSKYEKIRSFNKYLEAKLKMFWGKAKARPDRGL